MTANQISVKVRGKLQGEIAYLKKWEKRCPNKQEYRIKRTALELLFDELEKEDLI